MTRQEFLSALEELGYTQATFAAYIGRAPTTVYKYGVDNDIPQWIIQALKILKRDQVVRAYIYTLDPDSIPLIKGEEQ